MALFFCWKNLCGTVSPSVSFLSFSWINSIGGKGKQILRPYHCLWKMKLPFKCAANVKKTFDLILFCSWNKVKGLRGPPFYGMIPIFWLKTPFLHPVCCMYEVLYTSYQPESYPIPFTLSTIMYNDATWCYIQLTWCFQLRLFIENNTLCKNLLSQIKNSSNSNVLIDWLINSLTCSQNVAASYGACAWGWGAIRVMSVVWGLGGGRGVRRGSKLHFKHQATLPSWFPDEHNQDLILSYWKSGPIEKWAHRCLP